MIDLNSYFRMRFKKAKLAPICYGVSAIVMVICVVSYMTSGKVDELEATATDSLSTPEEHAEDLVMVEDTDPELQAQLLEDDLYADDMEMELEIETELDRLDDEFADYERVLDEELLQEQLELQEELESLERELAEGDAENDEELLWQEELFVPDGGGVRDENINAEIPYKINYMND